MKPGASIGETRQPLPLAPDDDHRQSRPGSSGKLGVSITTCQQRRRVPPAVARDPGNPPAKALSGARARANSAPRSPPAGSGARFSRRHSLAIPAAGRPTTRPRPTSRSQAPRSLKLDSRSRWRPMAIIARAGRPKHCQARDHGQPMKPGASIVETRQPFPGAPDGDHRRQPPAGQIGQIRASRSPPAGSGARFSRQSLAIPATGRPRNCQAREHGQPHEAGRPDRGRLDNRSRWHWPSLITSEQPVDKATASREHASQFRQSRRLDR